jgi:GGDEF domain-containing protein
MHIVAVGFWGAFFGTVALMLAGALVAYAKSHHRVALSAAATSLLVGLFVLSYLGWLSISDAALEARLLAHVSVFTAAWLGLMLLRDLGRSRALGTGRSVRWRVLGLAAITVAAGWLLTARQALALSSAVAFAAGLAALLVAIRSAQRGDRLARFAVFGVSFMLVAMAGLSWIALDRTGVPWLVHPVSALAGIAYLTTIETMLWRRYSYLIELREVLAQGPRYDPVTRMPSDAAVGRMVGLAFMQQQQTPARALVLIAISIGNLYALEKLHGRAAVNHALFICASRLRRCVPAEVEMARLFDDGFLLVSRNPDNRELPIELCQVVAHRLSRAVALRTSVDDLDTSQAKWTADVGVGLLVASSHANPSVMIAKVSDAARAARSYMSRVAGYDDVSGTISELSPARNG